MNNNLDMGIQPLDALLDKLGIKNSDLVARSTDQLTFKNVTKGRKGRRLTLNMQVKILKALNACQTEKQYHLEDLFNYSPKKE